MVLASCVDDTLDTKAHEWWPVLRKMQARLLLRQENMHSWRRAMEQGRDNLKRGRQI